jgi:hypothetical protein
MKEHAVTVDAVTVPPLVSFHSLFEEAFAGQY